MFVHMKSMVGQLQPPNKQISFHWAWLFLFVFILFSHSASSAGPSAPSPSTAAQRRAHRRLTREDNRYHSGRAAWSTSNTITYLLTYYMSWSHGWAVVLDIVCALSVYTSLLFITFFSIFTLLKFFFSLLLSSALFFSLLFHFSFPSPILHYWHQILLGLFFICYTIKLLGQNASFLLIIKFSILMLQFHCILNVLLTSVSVAVFSIVIEVL